MCKKMSGVDITIGPSLKNTTASSSERVDSKVPRAREGSDPFLGARKNKDSRHDGVSPYLLPKLR